MEYVSSLFDMGRFMPHGMCFLWRWDLLLLHVGSDFLIAVAYFTIPAALLVLIRKRPDIPHNVFLMFVSFIMLCGITHLFGIVVVWYPIYAVEGVFKFATAAVSLFTAIKLWPLIPHLVALPTVNQMEARNREIDALNRKLQQRVDSLSTLAGGVAHDFNNLLTVISGNSEILQMSEQDQRKMKNLEAIMAATQRATNVSRRMLAYSGHGGFMFSHVDINKVILDTELPRAPHVALEFDLAENLNPIEVSPEQVKQMLQDLYVNAMEAIEERGGGGRITISTRTVQLGEGELAAAAFEHNVESGEAVILEVRDDGVGMEENILEKIFDPFFSTKFTGRGLGLSSVQGIVRGHDACLFISSKPGEGTSIRIAFPSVKRSTVFYRPRKIRSPELILVVDDEADILALCESYCRRLGTKALTAINHRDALMLVKRHQHELDAVLVDYLMPSVSGIELLQRIRQIIDVDTYLTSGYTRGEISDPEVRKLLTGFVPKPFVFEDFRKIFGGAG